MLGFFHKKSSDFKVMNAENLHEWMNEFVSNVPWRQRREISQHLWEVRGKLFDINRFVKFATILEIPSFQTKTFMVYVFQGIAVGKLASKIDVSDVDALSNSNPLSTLLLGATRLLPLLQSNQRPR